MTAVRGTGADRYRALADPRRRHLLRVLEDAGGSLDAAALGAAVGRHPNTVREHLVVLERAGLVTRTIEERTRPGRPRVLFAPASGADGDAGGDGYRFLAEVLAGSIEHTADVPAEVGERAGREWGRHLIERPADGSSGLSSTDALERIVASLAELGFEPEVHECGADVSILLHDCPFRDVARRQQDVVCSVHLGLLRGMSERLGGALDMEGIDPFVGPSLCSVRVSARG
ncbi:MAG: helix-turn-helix domain-containing protein [Actinobacteria bacterium]|nr:helix-turn-helix domain-containing protein [Actinomycetota bacterium]